MTGRVYNGNGREMAKGLVSATSFAIAAIENVKTALARQRHNALLENYTDAQVANLVAYLATGQLG